MPTGKSDTRVYPGRRPWACASALGREQERGTGCEVELVIPAYNARDYGMQFRPLVPGNMLPYVVLALY